MTIINDEKLTCAVCGKESRQYVLLSASAFGPSDLDLRPAQPARGAIMDRIQGCGSCGYVAPSIDHAPEGVAAIVASDAYKTHAGDFFFMDCGQRFQRAAFLSAALGDTLMAAEYLLDAAWVADDKDEQEAAKDLRNQAADRFKAAIEARAELDAPELQARLVDVLRRAERWPEAIGLADQLLAQDLDATVRAVVRYGREKAEARDGAAYTLEDAGALE